MCGLIAALGVQISEARMNEALERLRHRGPDARGQWRSPGIHLAHSRLSVIQPLDGHQPIESEDAQIALVVNGEFYDFERQRRELEVRGHRFRTGSDSEIALHLYEELGLGFLEQLRGEFALLLWDGRRRRLLAARDRFGIKPLCYAPWRRGWLLASEAKALFSLGLPAAWNQRALLHCLSHQYLLPQQSLFEGVKAIPPAHCLIIEEEQAWLHRYWDLNLPREGEPRTGSAEEMFSQLEEAVALRLRADAPLGFYLSGGIDSATLLALAAPQLSQPARCLSVSFEGRLYDEAPLAQEMARHVGAELNSVPVSQEAILESLPEAVYFSEGLAINGQLSAKYLLAKAAQAEGLKVVLTGEGADEALLGYPHLRQDLLLSQGQAPEPSAEDSPSSGVMLLEPGAPPLESIRRALGAVPSFLRAKAALGRPLIKLLSPEHRQSLKHRDPFSALLASFEVEEQLRGRHPVDQASYLWTRLALAGYILRTLGDGTEMAASLEGRTPFLDHLFFERAVALPMRDKIRDGVEKYALRGETRALLPEAINQRRKHPFLAPPLCATPKLWARVREQISGQTLPLFEERSLQAWLKSLEEPKLRRRAEPALMLLLSAGALQKNFAMGEGSL